MTEDAISDLNSGRSRESNDGKAGKGYDEALQLHAALHEKVSDCPLVAGNEIGLLPGGHAAVRAIFDAIARTRSSLLLEYFTIEDVDLDGLSLFDLLCRKAVQGVGVWILYDAAGSRRVPPAALTRLSSAGISLLEFRPFNPLRGHFSWRLNDRDHRKLLVSDGREAFIGGVNLSHVYLNPPGRGLPPNPDDAFWYDAAIRVTGPSVAEVEKLFWHSWRRHGGAKAAALAGGAASRSPGGETVRIDGSAPRERRQLYFDSLCVAVGTARDRIILATGYFVPTVKELAMLSDAARRGVEVLLLLPGYSDVPSCLHAGRAVYGQLLEDGVQIHELRDGMLHAKVSTIDGVWTAIGSSNLDRRSFQLNNEIDAIILGRKTAADVETLLRGWMARAELVTFAGWKSRSLRERCLEGAARLWERYL